MKKLFDNVLNFIYPPACGFCGEICKEYLCKKCEISIIKNLKCKIDIYNESINRYYNEHLYLFKYEGKIREKILDYKFNDKSYLYKTFSEIILKNKKACGFLNSYDIIIPIPIHKKRKKERGYNQSELIAKDIVNRINSLKMDKDNLYKCKHIKPQSTLTKKERTENIKGAYRIRDKSKIEDKKIIILDDVYTTGSTVNECSKILKEAGAEKIGILTIAKD